MCFAFGRIKSKLEDVEYAHLPNVEADEEISIHHDGDSTKHATRRRGLRSDRSLDSNANDVSHAEGNNNIKTVSRYGFNSKSLVSTNMVSLP